MDMSIVHIRLGSGGAPWSDVFMKNFKITALALLLIVAFGTIQGQGLSTKDDELARTIAACGKPARTYTFPAEQKTKYLSYRRVTLWFMDGDQGWSFMGWGATAEELPVLHRDGVAKLLPCFAKVVPAAQPAAPPESVATSVNTNTSGTDFSGVAVAIAWVIGAILYFVPWMVAARRHVRKQAGIIVLNLLLGWTFLGWVGALIWAISAEVEPQAGSGAVASAH